MLFKYCRYRFPAPPGKAAFEGRGGPFHSPGNERIAADSPAYDLQQACGTSLATTINVANKIALGQIEWGIAGGVDTTSDAPIVLRTELGAGHGGPTGRYDAWRDEARTLAFILATT